MRVSSNSPNWYRLNRSRCSPPKYARVEVQLLEDAEIQVPRQAGAVPHVGPLRRLEAAGRRRRIASPHGFQLVAPYHAPLSTKL